jgi:solute carrier family 25 (mitochondrial phosphate transporter), member 3
MVHDRRRRALVALALQAVAGAATVATAAPPSLSASPPLALSHVLLSFAVFALVAAAAKSSTLLPPHAHARVDRFTAACCALMLLATLRQQIMIAAAAGSLSLHRFAQYFVAGGICAFLTHAACTPIDVVKTRIQTTHSGKYTGLLDGVRKIVADEGPNALLKGLGATAGGYFLHGAFKYSFYEVFKVLLSPNAAVALNPPLLIAAASGFCAECIACLLLCPMEAVRIRSVSDPNFPSGALAGLAYISRTEGSHGLYKGLAAMLLKQVPYTVGQFVAFECAVTSVRAMVMTALAAGKGPVSSSAVAFISTVAGLLAGVFAAVISQPGDTILSKVNQEQGDEGAFAQIQRVVRAAGVLGLFSGLSVRILQVSCMVGGQFLIYDAIKMVRPPVCGRTLLAAEGARLTPIVSVRPVPSSLLPSRAELFPQARPPARRPPPHRLLLEPQEADQSPSRSATSTPTRPPSRTDLFVPYTTTTLKRAGGRRMPAAAIAVDKCVEPVRRCLHVEDLTMRRVQLRDFTSPCSFDCQAVGCRRSFRLPPGHDSAVIATWTRHAVRLGARSSRPPCASTAREIATLPAADEPCRGQPR